MNWFLGSQNAMTCLSDVFKSPEYNACIRFLFLIQLDSQGWDVYSNYINRLVKMFNSRQNCGGSQRVNVASDLPKNMKGTRINLARFSGINLHISAVLLSGPETGPVFVNPELSEEVSSSLLEVNL